MRRLVVAAAQLGPVEIADSRRDTLERLIAMLREAAAQGVELVVFPELALTSFFPHWLITDPNELVTYYEAEMPGPDTQALFEEARRLGVAFVLGYAEVTDQGRLFNSAVLVDRTGSVVGKYRKIHLPGFAEHQVQAEHQLLEKRYFEVGDLGFTVADLDGTLVGLAICNDRRWPETYRVQALKGAEIACIGYNTPVRTPHLPEIDTLTEFQNHLAMQAGAYQNSMWVVGAAKAGTEAGVAQIGGSCIVAPSGQVVAQATSQGDELVAASIDLDMVTRYRAELFNFTHHRRPEHYGPIVDNAGIVHR